MKHRVAHLKIPVSLRRIKERCVGYVSVLNKGLSESAGISVQNNCISTGYSLAHATYAKCAAPITKKHPKLKACALITRVFDDQLNQGLRISLRDPTENTGLSCARGTGPLRKDKFCKKGIGR